jgi:branched-chain amino acid transport system permease protein
MWQQLTNGLALAGLYVTFAIGMALIYGVLRILHIAHGTMLLIGAYSSLLLLPFFGNNLFITVSIGSLIAGALGTLMGTCIYYPLLKKRKYDAILLASTALLISSQETFMVIFGARHKQFPTAVNAIAIDILGVKVFLIQLICAITSLICMLFLWLFLSKTDTGRAIRAIDQNPTLASLCGVNFLKTCIVTLFIGSTLGGLSGGLLGLYYNDVHPELADIVTIALCIIIVGGLGSIPGSIVAGLLLALLETFALAYIPISFPRTLTSYIALIIVLLLRPQGIMGRTMR